MFRTTVILCTIAAQVFAAPKPNGCIEACSTYSTQQTHEALVQQQTAMLNQLQQVAASHIGGVEFSRPGNWTEHNEYRTDGGRGRVFEEQGQVVTGPKRVQYYRKNYSSASGVNTATGGLGGVGGIDSTLSSQRLSGGLLGGLGGIETPLDSQRLVSATSGRGGVGHHSTYDEQRHQEIHQSSNRVGSHSQILEDLGERVDDTQQVLHQVPTTSGGQNWHRADSWRTDGGRGVVHEEEGQVVNGPTKVKYYRQNYSSSYSSGDAGAAVPTIPNLDDHLQRVQSQFDSFGREIHQSTVGQSTVIGQTVGHAGYVDENNLATANIRTRPGYVHRVVPSSESLHTSTTGHRTVIEPVTTTNQRYHVTRGDQRYQQTQSSGSDYSATNSQIDDQRDYQRPQTYRVVSEPRTTVRKTEDHHVYHQETIAPQSQIVVSDSNRQTVDRTNEHLIRTPIHTGTDYKSFHSNGEVQGNRLTTGYTHRMTAEEIRQAQIRQSEILSQNTQQQDSYSDGNVETLNVVAQQPAAVNRYEEKWSEGYRSHSTIPQPITSGQIVVGQHANYVQTGQTAGQLGTYSAGTSHNSHSRHESGSHFYEGFRTQPERLVTGALTVGSIGQTGADCDQTSGVTTSEQYQYGAVHHRKYKRDAPEFHGQETQQLEDLTQQTAGFDDFYQQHSGKLEAGQHSQQTEDLAQQTSGFDQFTQQASGNLELGQETQQTEDLTQQISGFGDFGQQTSGKLELGQHTQQTEDLTQQTQQSEDLTQQTSGFGDFGQQTSGHLELGQQHEQQHFGKLDFGQQTQQTEDLTQQTQQSEDLTQQTQQSEDLTQQTQQTEDLTQQTSGHLEFGQQHLQHTGKLELGQETQQTQKTETVLTPEPVLTLDFDHQTDNSWVRAHEAVGHKRHTSEIQQSEDLTQQSEDLTQQTSGHLELSQQHEQQSGRLELGQQTQQTEDLTQQTAHLDHSTQQTSGNFVFEQLHQHDKRGFGQETQQTEDLTQQTSGHLEIGQQQQHLHQRPGMYQTPPIYKHPENYDFVHQQPGEYDFSRQHPGSGNAGRPHSGRRTSGHEHPARHIPEHQHPGSYQTHPERYDVVRRQPGDYDFSRQHPGSHNSGHRHSGSHNSGHQHSGHYEIGHQHHQNSGHHEIGQETQQTEDLTQQTTGLGDLMQQTSGHLELGQQHQSDQHEFGQETQQTEDLTQQTGGFDDFTQQTSGHLQLGQQHQTSQHEFGQETQQTEDLTQQTGGFDDFTQQTSGHLELGQQHQTGHHEFGQETQQTEDLTQQTGGFDDFTQQTSGHLELGQQHQTGHHEFGQETQQTEDLTQQTSGFGDLMQQTSGHLELGQQHHTGPHEFGQETQQTEDLTQQTGGFDDFTQQTSGNLQLGQQPQTSQHEFGQETQQTEDLTQQTGGFDDFTQQTSGHLQLGQQHQTSQHEFGQETQQTEDLTQQTGGFDDFTQQTSGHLQLGQQHQTGHQGFGQETQQTEDLTQQTGGFDDFTQQTSGHLQLGQQHQTSQHEFGQETQQTEDLTQQTGGFDDFTQQSSGIHDFGEDHTTTARPRPAYQPGVKGGRRRIPAPKPTLKPGRKINIENVPKTPSFDEPKIEPTDRYNEANDKIEDVPTVLEIDEPDTHEYQNQVASTTINPNAQWHQNHHPGDLTRTENLESQVFNHQVVHQEHVTQTVRQYPTKSGAPRRQIGNVDSRPSRQNSPVEGENSEPEFKFEPRIIEAYGGAGSYDADHNDDLFSGAKHNPSATIPPNPEGADPWDIREKPFEAVDRRPVYAQPTEETTTVMPEEPTTVAPSFWSRVGHKLSNTYEKAKEKATSIFGK